MDYANERYVRLYTRDTKTWCLLGWEGQALLGLLLRKLDRAGLLEDVFDADDVLVLLGNGMPIELITVGLDRLVRRGVLERTERGLISPNFIEAQETAQSNRQRNREWRAKRRDRALASGSSHESDDTFAESDETSHHEQTKRHASETDRTPRARVGTARLGTAQKDREGPGGDDAGVVQPHWQQPNQEPDTQVPCPGPDQALTESQIRTLETSMMVPRWAIDAMLTEWCLVRQARGDRHTLRAWRTFAAKDLRLRWNDPASRPKKPDDPDSKRRAAAEARRLYDEENARFARENDERLRRRAEERGKQCEKPDCQDVLEGIGGPD
jgi:hypothetical protein